MKRVLIACSLVVLLPYSAFAGNCSIPQFSVVYGNDSDASMVVKSGVSCFARINPGAAIASAAIEQNAANGMALVQNTHSWGYRSKPGFSGSDSFVVNVAGTNFSGRDGRLIASGASRVRFNVSVTP